LQVTDDSKLSDYTMDTYIICVIYFSSQHIGCKRYVPCTNLQIYELIAEPARSTWPTVLEHGFESHMCYGCM